MIDTRRLNLLCEVASKGSFTAAAAALHFTQSAVSQQIAILEKEMGVALVLRRPRGVELTEAGRNLVERGAPLLDHLRTLERETHRLFDGPSRIGLGIFASAGAHLAPAVVRRFRERGPGAALSLQECQPGELPHALETGEIDAGLTWDYDFAPRPVKPDLISVRLMADPLQVVLPREHWAAGVSGGLALDDLAEESWVARRHQPPYDNVLETISQVHGFEPHVVFRVGDYQTMQGMVAAGVGIGLAPRLALLLRRDDLVVRTLREPLVRRIDAVVLPAARADGGVRRLLRALEEVAEEVTATTEAAPGALGPDRPHSSSWLTPGSLAGGSRRASLASIRTPNHPQERTR